MPIRIPPDWPGAMRRETAAMYCDMTAAQFIREVDSDRLPQPFKLGGKEMWSRVTIDQRIAELAGEGVPDWRATSPLYNPEISMASERQEKRRRKPASIKIGSEDAKAV